MKLNLGCGKRHLVGYTNVDEIEPADKLVTLTDTPWPWDDSSVDEIYMRNVMEHFADPDARRVMAECWRVLKPDGLLHIIVPHGMGKLAHFPSHLSFWTISVFNAYTGRDEMHNEFMLGVEKQLFRKVSLRYRIFDRWATWLDTIASRYPVAWEASGILPPSTVDWKVKAIK